MTHKAVDGEAICRIRAKMLYADDKTGMVDQVMEPAEPVQHTAWPVEASFPYLGQAKVSGVAGSESSGGEV